MSESFLEISASELDRKILIAACEVWKILELGTRHPRVVVTGTVKDRELTIRVAGGKEIAVPDPEEITSFHVGPPRWTITVQQWENWLPAGSFENWDGMKIWECGADRFSDFYAENNTIWKGLFGGKPNWLARHNIKVIPKPKTFLRVLIRRRNRIVAAALAHAYLHHVARERVIKASNFFYVCRILKNSPDAETYRSTVRLGLKALSTRVNAMPSRNGRINRDLLYIHKELLVWSRAPYPGDFCHDPNAVALARLL